MKLVNKTFDSEDCPKSTARAFEVTSLFRDAFFQFNSFYVMLYVQLCSPIIRSTDYVTMFTVISLVLIFSKILAGFCWTLASHLLENVHFKLGNYRTLTFVGSIVSTIAFVLMFFVSPLFEGWTYVVVFLILYTLEECLYSINDIGYWSIVNKLSYDEKHRSHISSITNVMTSIGGYTVSALSPALANGNLTTNLRILALVLVSTYFIACMVYCFVMKERKEPRELHKEKTPWYEGVKILFTDKEVFLEVFCLFCAFLAQDIVISNTATYFYYEYGYGSFGATPYGKASLPGGAISFFFCLLYGIGITISEFLYTPLSAKYGKKKLLIFFTSCQVVIYLLMFFFGFTAGNEILLFILVFLLAFTNGFLYMSYLMNSFNVAEYYEYKTGKERSASTMAIKALGVKTANGVQTGAFYLTLLVSGLLAINQQVASLEATGSTGDQINNTIHASDISSNLLLYRSLITFLPMALMIIAALISIFCISFTDEKKYAFYVAEVKKRRESLPASGEADKPE